MPQPGNKAGTHGRHRRARNAIDMTLLQGTLAQQARIGSGLVLFAFALSHCLNHALGLVSVEGSELERVADLAIAVVVGPEFLAGSTRLKAGTAQKLVLNMLSTISMIRLGKTYGNLMVDVAASNEKLRERVRRIVRTATGADDVEVDRALDEAGGEAKVAIVSLLAGVSAEESRARLQAAGDRVRGALES